MFFINDYESIVTKVITYSNYGWFKLLCKKLKQVKKGIKEMGNGNRGVRK
jgi:hypothetical protein